MTKESTEKKSQQAFADLDGNVLPFAKKIPKRWRDLLVHTLGSHRVDGQSKVFTFFDPENPVGDALIKGDPENPLCKQCTLFEGTCSNPFMRPTGSKNPVITVVMDGVTMKEDAAGAIASKGPAAVIYEIISKLVENTGIDPRKHVRWIATTLCAVRQGDKSHNLATRGNWCRYFTVQDILLHPPKLIIPVGTTALGLLSHKSNANDWAGKVLTYRGWPDDWLTDPKFMLPVVNPLTGELDFTGHPIFGKAPDIRIPMYPVQHPRLIRAMNDKRATARWELQVQKGILIAKDEVKVPVYNLPWYNYTYDPDVVEQELSYLIDNPGTLVAYDTETTGLKPWLGEKITIMMFRWVDKEGNPKSVGFPWDYPESPLVSHIPRLKKVVLEAMYASKIVGHNLTFDMQFMAANFGLNDRDTEKLVNVGVYDTWHMAYTHKQQRGSLGLELLTYQYAPDLAGYEEEFVLLADLHKETLHPAGKKGGHYALCPEDKVQTHLKPYVMGDVEATYRIREELEEKLDKAHHYTGMPLAHPTERGRFRSFSPPHRSWVYSRIISPANILLTKLMCRGLHVDENKLAWFEAQYPTRIDEARKEVETLIPAVKRWADTKRVSVPKWEFDLEDKALLKELLFHDSCLNLPVQRLTKAGKQRFGEDPEAIKTMTSKDRYAYAAVDKFTLNKLAADFPDIRPLQDYRKFFKLYTAFVRPMRNSYSSVIDRKERDKHQHLCSDGRVHASFLLTGTRGGRLSCKDPNLQQLPNDADVKQMFTSRFGERGCIYAGDLSQIELRLLAAACGDENMMKAYFEDLDLHTLTTSRIFKLDYEMFSKAHMEKLQKEGRGKEAKDLELKRKIGKCVDPSTLVSVNGETVRIGDLHEGREDDTFYDLSGVSVQIPGGRGTPIKQFYSSGIKPRLLVCSSQGAVACSREHRFRLSDGSLKRAGDLKKGDVLANAEALESADTTQPIPFNPFSGENTSGSFCVHPTDDFAYALGLFYGDGTCNANSVSVTTGGTPDYFEWQDSVAESLSKAGFTVKTKRTVEGKDSVFGLITFGSRRVIDALRQLGSVTVEGDSCKRTLQIPTWLLNASQSTKLSFLAGLIDTDGSVSKRGDVSICTKSWSFAQDLMVMMRSVGIVCSLCPGWNKTYERYYYEVNIAKRSNAAVSSLLRNQKKASRITVPKFDYKYETANKVKLVTELTPGHLVDISIAEPHLYLANGLPAHNTCNFLTGYGGGAFGLQTTLANNKIYMELKECEEILEMFFGSYPTLKKFLAAYKYFIESNCAAVSITGRVRIFEEVRSDDMEAAAKALRAGCNHLIQATASDMMLVCLRAIEAAMRDNNLESVLVSTVHDSLVIDAVRSELPVVHDIVFTVLNNITEIFELAFGSEYDTSWMLVPFGGDCEVGPNYGDMRKVPVKGEPDWDALLSTEDE